MKQRKRRIKLALIVLKHRITNIKPRVKLYKRLWTFHQYDDDPFPSVPHGHYDEEQLKLSLFDGSVYKGKSRTPIGSASKKELRNLQKNQEFVDFTDAVVNWYKEKYPNVPIKVPAWVLTRTRIKAISVNQKQPPATMVVAIEVMLKNTIE